jgi:WD40 repeat protein
VNGIVRAWDPRTGQHVGHPMTGHTDTVTGVAWSPDGTMLATGAADGTVRFWDAATHNPLGQPLVAGRLRTLAFNPSGDLLVTGGSDGIIRTWDVWDPEVACDLVRPYVTRQQVADLAPATWTMSACNLR